MSLKRDFLAIKVVKDGLELDCWGSREVEVEAGLIELSKALWPLTLLLKTIAEGHMQIGPGQGLSGRPPLWLVPVHSSS